MPVPAGVPVAAGVSVSGGEAAVAVGSGRVGVFDGVGDVDGLLGCFAGVDDPRDPRGVRHSLATILGLCEAAVLSGCTELVEVTSWVCHADQELLGALGCRRDATGRCTPPHPDTIDRVLGLVDAHTLAQQLGAHLGARAGMGPAAAPVAAPGLLPALAIDGKAVRGAIGADGGDPLPARRRHSRQDHRDRRAADRPHDQRGAPCGALSHLSFSEEELGGKFLDPPAYPDTER